MTTVEHLLEIETVLNQIRERHKLPGTDLPPLWSQTQWEEQASLAVSHYRGAENPFEPRNQLYLAYRHALEAEAKNYARRLIESYGLELIPAGLEQRIESWNNDHPELFSLSKDRFRCSLSQFILETLRYFCCGRLNYSAYTLGSLPVWLWCVGQWETETLKVWARDQSLRVHAASVLQNYWYDLKKWALTLVRNYRGKRKKLAIQVVEALFSGPPIKELACLEKNEFRLALESRIESHVRLQEPKLTLWDHLRAELDVGDHANG